MLPSPTAEATRLTLPARTSTTAITPGRLVSNGCGNRSETHRLELATSFPVHTKPLSSVNAAVQKRGIVYRPQHQEKVFDAVNSLLARNAIAPGHFFE